MDSSVEDLAKVGKSLYENSYDHHSINHVERMLNMSKSLIKAEGLQSRIDQDVLNLSIIWHDVWKASQVFKNSRSNFLFELIYEGIGSAKMFKNYLKKYHLDKTASDKIVHSILVHQGFEYALPYGIRKNFDRLKYTETKILRDLDVLESSISLAFLNEFKEKMFPLLKSNPKMKKMWILFFKSSINKIREDYFTYEWSKKQFKEKSEEFTRHAKEIIKEMSIL